MPKIVPPDVLAARERLKSMKSERVNKARFQSMFKHVYWNRNTMRWQVGVHAGSKYWALGAFKPTRDSKEAQMSAAYLADRARWELQDFSSRAPDYNFPEELPPFGEPHPRILDIRRQLLAAGYPQNTPHHPQFVPHESATVLLKDLTSEQVRNLISNSAPSAKEPAACEVCNEPTSCLNAAGECGNCDESRK